MKTIFLCAVVFLFFLFALPVQGGSAIASNPQQSFTTDYAPGSIVRFEHLTIEDGLSQSAGLAIF